MKKIILPVFFLIFIFCCTLLKNKQFISGTIVSKTTNKPIEKVTVNIKGTDISSLTDSTGFYTISCKNFTTFQLAFIHKDYETTQVDVVVDENKNKYRINVALVKKQ